MSTELNAFHYCHRHFSPPTLRSIIYFVGEILLSSQCWIFLQKKDIRFQNSQQFLMKNLSKILKNDAIQHMTKFLFQLFFMITFLQKLELNRTLRNEKMFWVSFLPHSLLWFLYVFCCCVYWWRKEVFLWKKYQQLFMMK